MGRHDAETTGWGEVKIYLRILSVFYGAGAFLHLLDIFGLRLNYAEMSLVWKAWTLFLLIADSAASLGLWNKKRWGIVMFQLIALTELIVYLTFSSTFGKQPFLVGFHILTLGLYVILLR